MNSPFGDYTIQHPTVATNPKEIQSIDIVFLSVKGYHLPGTIPSLKKLTKDGAYVLPVLNGIEHINMLQEQLGSEVVLGGMSMIIATLDRQGHVIHSSSFHKLVFGTLTTGQHSFCKRFAELAEKGKIEAIHSPTILRELWKKYMFINAFSGITTAVNLPIGRIREHKETFQLAVAMLHDMKLVANAYHVDVTDTDVEEARENLLNLPDEATSSMHQDRRKGLPLELNHLHGGALRLAKAVGLTIPYTEAVYGMIKPYE